MGTNTGIGIGIGIPFRNNALGGDNIYFPPELKARMIGVWDNYGKKNTDADRNIIKNKIPNAGGDLEILNSAYRLNSGFGGYSNDFQEYTYSENVVVKDNTNAVFNAGGQLLIPYPYLTKDIPSFKIKVSGLSGTYHFRYYYRDSNGIQDSVNIAKDGNYELPICYNVQSSFDGTNCGFVNNGSDIITVEILPAFEGALVTDGINDIVASIKTLEDWNVGNKGITIISMIHQITTNKNFTTTNNLRNEGRVVGRNVVSNTGKTGIYGWYKEDLQGKTATLISNILGDKNDYTGHYTESTNPITNSKFYVQGYAIENGFTELSSVAHYWTFAVLGKATEDEINLIIAKYNLDRTLRPDILCNITKQGITNDNHADFNDKLVDYSGNGRDVQMNNLAWKGGSGIAAKPFETIKDYTIVSDEARQKLTIYNEFSYKIKSNTPSYYWTVQSIIRDNTSYQVTIITDKDCYWINATSFINSEGNKENIRKKYPVLANTPTQVIICGLDQFEYPEGIEPTNAVSYVNLEYAGEITITFIPSHKGGLLLDGVNDFGKVTRMPVYKDYTFIIEREFLNKTFPNQVCLVSKSKVASEIENGGAFIVDNISVNSIINPYSFYKTTSLPGLNTFDRQIVFQSKYKYLDKDIAAGTATDSDTLWLGTFRDNDSRFANVAIYSLMSFPYSMSEFLIERQLKKYKLGSLYPNMVEFRPVIKANANYNIFYTALLPLTGIVWEKINIGDYIPVGRRVAIQLSFDNEASELVSAISSQLGNISITKNSNNKGYTIFGDILKNKSPQKINITIDEYIRYEDIVQPYPLFFEFTDENGNLISWGGKAKVGSTITRTKGVNYANLLEGLFTITNPRLNRVPLSSSQHVVEKSMVFTCTATWAFDNNEPKCILSPRLLSIPNSSYKILGYIPDISGHGNHGVIHNSAYAEGSGVNEDGSYQFDGVDDFITIPTTVGGKQVLMKVNWQKSPALLYDQRASGSFAVLTTLEDDAVNPRIAYQARNQDGKTYIDGIENNNIETYTLKDITHNITIANSSLGGIIVPVIGCNTGKSSNFAKMSLYDFMLFDNISTDDKIKELNEYVGIEAKVELPPYYWDAYGKTNLDEDKDTIQQRGVAEGDYDITNYNHAYDKMSGYGGYNLSRFDKSWSSSSNTSIKVVQRNPYDITLKKLGGNSDWEFNNTELKVISNPVSVKFKSNKNIKVTCDYHYYPVGGNSEGTPLRITSKDLIANKDAIITISPISQENIDKYNIDVNRGYYLIYFQLSSTLAVNEEVTIEMLPLYPNALLYDGVTDYSKNANIPALTDFTYVFKRKLLDNVAGCASMTKGLTHQQRAVVIDYINTTGGINGTSFGNMAFVPSLRDSDIIYSTTTNINGTTITKGNNPDSNGIDIGKFATYYKKMVFYKLILYPKTIPLLQINFLKNLMERDEIIDLNNPIFKNESNAL